MNSQSSTHYRYTAALILPALLALHGCGSGGSGQAAEPDFARVTALGGETTDFSGAQVTLGFDSPAANLVGENLDLHRAGDVEFEATFIKAVSAEFPAMDGVGPVFNNSACEKCHTLDGRDNYTLKALQAPKGEWTKLGAQEGVFLRISVGPNEEDEVACVPTVDNCYCGPQKVPGFSDQLFHRGVLGVRDDGSHTGQADVYVKFVESEVTYGDGEKTTLSKPVFEIRNPYDAPGEKPGDNTPPLSRLLQADVNTSPRMGMPVFGLGLLEAIPEADILALAEEQDKDGTAITGRPNWVCDPSKKLQGDPDPRSLGRFGWKASTPTTAIQGSGAYRGDMGVTNYFFPDESIVNTVLHDSYLATNPGDDGQQGAEVPEETVKSVMFYTNTLAVPARRNVDDPTVLAGATLFDSSGCSDCHHPSFETGTHRGIWGPSGITPIPEVENQTIYPFTDMLLHDMGERLADGRTDFVANGREWKTRPLWGIGLTQVVNPLAGFLHDSRANSLEEAILWHGGEAEEAKETFRTMKKADREALIAFLNSL